VATLPLFVRERILAAGVWINKVSSPVDPPEKSSLASKKLPFPMTFRHQSFCDDDDI
jgi:hypothetical protein